MEVIKGLESCNDIENQTPTPMFFCEYCQSFKKTYFEEHMQMAVSVLPRLQEWEKLPILD